LRPSSTLEIAAPLANGWIGVDALVDSHDPLDNGLLILTRPHHYIVPFDGSWHVKLGKDSVRLVCIATV
jgi:hypothetical protein